MKCKYPSFNHPEACPWDDLVLFFSSTASFLSGRPTMHCSWFAACSRSSSGRWAKLSCTSSSPTRRGHQDPAEVSSSVFFTGRATEYTKESAWKDFAKKKKRCCLRISSNVQNSSVENFLGFFALECTLRKTSCYLLGNLQHSLRFWFPSEFLEVSNRGYGLVLDVSYNNCQLYKTSFHT